MIAGVEVVGEATKWVAVQTGVDIAMTPAMARDFVHTNCFCCVLVVIDEESSSHHCPFFVLCFIIVV
jgi:hypothetical protein